MESVPSNDVPQADGYPRRDVIRFVVKTAIGVVFLGLLLFLPDGTLEWPMAWTYLGIFMVVNLASAWAVDPELLLEERGIGKEGRKRWDVILVSFYGIFTALVSPIVAGFDRRYGWSPVFPLWLQTVTLVIYILAWVLSIWAMACNKYFSKVLRIQAERGHTVVASGPYRYVRHPRLCGHDPVQPGHTDHPRLAVGDHSGMDRSAADTPAHLVGGSYTASGVGRLSRLRREGMLSFDPRRVVITARTAFLDEGERWQQISTN